ncbi:Gfo/Idh/MocA family oxidoreductase [Saccharopolyspora indica]|uniref:Gfo/Idh/MocA family protein n=1 Tax=Saccharopolyspora indica TaxID=1229659 RepID=UPI0022EA1394|nr:Gfo/Idh/MocA family oxidoreductase [Saccharopolyspora indica]MDA3642411.1 Gfo/Idh/MocA family oxidoreductase [Saccharopolyspora indica]
MLHALVLGLGRAGAGLHLRVLTKARATAPELFHPGPVIGCDPAPGARQDLPGAITTDSLAAAAELLDPQRTVVHVCTPPTSRAAVLTRLAQHGFRRAIVEKPLATGTDDLREIDDLRRRHGLDLVVVSHWMAAELTERITALVRGGALGDLRSIRFTQDKPRFTRSAATHGHPTAFDVELPHSLGVVLQLAGPAEVERAACTDMHGPDAVLPAMGSAHLVLRHAGGVTSELSSDLTAPVQQRRIALELTGGEVTGHYPISDQDDHAQLLVDGQRQVFRDDALTRFVLRAYHHFQDPSPIEHPTLQVHREVVRLLAEAKQSCAAAAERSSSHAR